MVQSTVFEEYFEILASQTLTDIEITEWEENIESYSTRTISILTQFWGWGWFLNNCKILRSWALCTFFLISFPNFNFPEFYFRPLYGFHFSSSIPYFLAETESLISKDEKSALLEIKTKWTLRRSKYEKSRGAMVRKVWLKLSLMSTRLLQTF